MIINYCRLITLPWKNNLPPNLIHKPLPLNNLDKTNNWGGGYLVIFGGGGVKKRQGVKRGGENGRVKGKPYYNVYIIIYISYIYNTITSLSNFSFIITPLFGTLPLPVLLYSALFPFWFLPHLYPYPPENN